MWLLCDMFVTLFCILSWLLACMPVLFLCFNCQIISLFGLFLFQAVGAKADAVYGRMGVHIGEWAGGAAYLWLVRPLPLDAQFLTAIIGMSTDLGFMRFSLDGPGKSSVAGCLCSTPYEWPCFDSANMPRWYSEQECIWADTIWPDSLIQIFLSFFCVKQPK
jgi:hypothetical protein